MEMKEFWVDLECSFKIKATSEEEARDKAIYIVKNNNGHYLNILESEEIKRA